MQDVRLRAATHCDAETCRFSCSKNNWFSMASRVRFGSRDQELCRIEFSRASNCGRRAGWFRKIHTDSPAEKVARGAGAQSFFQRMELVRAREICNEQGQESSIARPYDFQPHSRDG